MKKSLFAIIILLYGYEMFSQQEVQQVEVIRSEKQVTELFDEIGDKEIKIDVIDLLSQPALNIGYEIINDAYSSYGAEILLNFNGENSSISWSEKISLNPFYRFYFLNKTDFGGEGYFAEVFLKLSFIQYDRDTFYYGPIPNEPSFSTDEVKVFDIAPGVGVGRKWVNKKGWTFEYMIGFGRYLFANNGDDDNAENHNYRVDNNRPMGTFKGGVSIGKRF